MKLDQVLTKLATPFQIIIHLTFVTLSLTTRFIKKNVQNITFSLLIKVHQNNLNFTMFNLFKFLNKTSGQIWN